VEQGERVREELSNHPILNFFCVQILVGVPSLSGKQFKHSYNILFIKVSK
jgi:hypothetical protein